MAVRIQLRRDTAANWIASNPVLRAGEFGVETDTLKVKVGNGSSNWNSITDYLNVVPTELSNYIATSQKGSANGVASLDASSNLIVPGSSIIIEGATPDSYELTLVATDPTADRTITLPDASGTVALTSDITSLTTDDIEESTSKYFTDERAQDAVAAAIAAGTHTNITITYDDNANTLSFTGAQTYSDENAVDATAAALAAGTHTNVTVSYNDEAGSISLSASPGYTDEQAQDAVAASLAAGTHSNITVSYNDGSNSISLSGSSQYTDEMAQDAIGNSVGNGLDYDDNTGSISVDPSEFSLNSVGAPTADVSMATYKITNLGTPVADTDAATKAYVDASTAGLNVHDSVKVATTTNINLATDLENGDTLDGVTLATGDRILVKNQTSKPENGIYVVAASGAASRAADYDTAGEVDAGDFIFVENGTVNAKTGWIQLNAVTTLGTDNIEFAQFSGAGTYAAGNGLSLTGTTFSINTSVTADLSTSQTLTNKTISVDNNTVSGIAASSFVLSNASGNIEGSVGQKAIPSGAVVGTTDTQTLTNKTLTSPTLTTPRFASSGEIDDANGAELIKFPATVASAVNEITISNAAASGTPSITASGNDTNISLNLSGKGTGTVQVGGVPVVTTTGTQTLTNKTLTTPIISSISNTGTITLPTSTDTLVGRDTTDTLTNKTINGANNTLTVRLANDVTGTLPIANGGTNITTYATGDILYASATNTLSKLAAGTNGHILTLSSGVPTWAAAPVSLPSQTGNAGKFLTTNGTTATWSDTPIITGTATLNTNTTQIIDSFVTNPGVAVEYFVTMRQGTKIRTSKVLVHTDSNNVDMTEFAIMELNGQMSGVAITASINVSSGYLNAVVTDAASTNVIVKFSKVAL